MHDCILIHLLCSDGRRPETDLPASPGSVPRCMASGATGDRERAGRHLTSARADVRHDLQRRMSTWISSIHSPSRSSVSCPQAGESVTTAFFRRGGRHGGVLMSSAVAAAATGAPENAGAGVAHNHDADPGWHASTKECTQPPSSRLPWCCGAPPAEVKHIQGRAGRQAIVPISYMRLSQVAAGLTCSSRAPSYPRSSPHISATLPGLTVRGVAPAILRTTRVARLSRRPDQHIRGRYEALR